MLKIITHEGVMYMSIIPEEKRVRYMDDLKKRKVVEHNDLITSVAKMDKVPMKIFELAVSCIDTEKPPENDLVYVSKKELYSFFSVSDTNKEARFKESIKKMQSQAFFEISEESGKRTKYKSIVPIPTVSWNDYDDEVTIRFNPDIMPYLIELRTNFTQYAISDIMELNSKYSVILYKWLCMHYNQYEHYKYKGNRTKKQLEEYQNPSIKMSELRKLTDTDNEYERMTNFTEWVLTRPLKEINEFTHFNVSYEKIRKGRSVDSLQFRITKKEVANNPFYKEEQNDFVFVQTKEQNEQERQKLFAEAMQSRYTTFLMEKMLIGYKDMQDIDTMANFQRLLYPLFDELKDMGGLNAVKEHISYLAEYQKGYSKENIVKYLFVSTERWVHNGAKIKYK